MTDSEMRAIREHLFSSPSHLDTAQAVFQAWPAIRDEVCERFLQHLTEIVARRAREAFAEIAHDLRVECRYGGRRKHSNLLLMYRAAWPKWQRESYTRGRTSIRMQAQQPGPYGWFWGVANTIDVKRMSTEERDRRSRLDAELPKHLNLGNSNDWWVQYAGPEEASANWDSLLSTLIRECQAGGGEITDYYADKMIDIAAKAIPVINSAEIESEGSRPGSSGKVGRKPDDR